MLDHDPIRLNRIMISSFCWSMISAQTLRVCREGKPVPTFPDHALTRLAGSANAFWHGEPGSGLFHGLGDQQRLFGGEREILNALMRGQRKHHDIRLVLGPAGGESRYKIR